VVNKDDGRALLCAPAKRKARVVIHRALVLWRRARLVEGRGRLGAAERTPP
jgi:hypothetical protein